MDGLRVLIYKMPGHKSLVIVFGVPGEVIWNEHAKRRSVEELTRVGIDTQASSAASPVGITCIVCRELSVPSYSAALWWTRLVRAAF